MRRPAARRALALAGLLLATGCPGFRTGRADVPGDEPASDAGSDAGSDTGSDAGSDTGSDTGFDTGFDVGFDAVPDAGVDVPVDRGPDVVEVGPMDVVDVPLLDAPADRPVDRPLPVDASEPVPRPVGPPVGALVTYPRPSLHWRLTADLVGASVQVCRDRACTTVESSFDATGASGTVGADLPNGPHFWRLRGRTSTATLSTWSPTWEFWISPLRPPRESAFGTVLDFDGDGVADLAIGSPGGAAGEGRVFLWRGPLSTASAPLPLSPGSESTVGFGQVVVPLGDVDGDGFVDLGVGSYDPAETQGRVEVFHGNAAFAAVRGRELTAATGRTFAFALDGAGDTNGDGYADVLVGQPGASDDRGRAYVYLGGPSGLGATPALTLAGRDLPGARFGYALAGGSDVDGDGFSDVVIAGPGVPAGQGGAYSYRGSASGLSVPSLNILAGDGDPDGRFGATVAHLGDVNDDGFSDYAVASPGSATLGGRVLIYRGGGGGLDPSPAAMLAAPTSPPGLFGAAVAGMGDLDGDGFGDLAVGAPAAGPGGRVTVAYGAPTLNSSLRRGIINGAFSSGGFGTAIASFDLLDRSFAVGVPNEASAARFVPAGTALPASPVFVYSLAGRPDFGRSIAGIW